MIVSKQLEPDEKCIRCLLHPLMFSHRKGLQNYCVLPPLNGNKVSLLRLRYAKDGLAFCFRFGKSLLVKNNEFVGLAMLTPNIVAECNAVIKNVANPVFAEIVYAPMTKGNYVDLTLDVDTDDPDIDLPMHADLSYYNLEEGDVKTNLRMYAHELIKKVEYALCEEDALKNWGKFEQ